MSHSDLVLFISCIFFVFWGISSLNSDQVYWGRLFEYWGRKLVTKGRTPARVHGLPVTAGGVLGIVTSVLAMFAPNSDVVVSLQWVCIILVLAGIMDHLWPQPWDMATRSGILLRLSKRCGGSTATSTGAGR